MDYTAILGMVVEIVEHAYPIAIIFGLCAKAVSFSLDLILNRKISL